MPAMNPLPPTVPIGLGAQVPQPGRLLMPEHMALVVSGLKAWQRRRQADESIALAAGLRILLDVVELCIDKKLPMVSIYLFSQDLHGDEPSTVSPLFPTFLQFLGKAAHLLTIKDVRLRFFGNRAALAPPLAQWLSMAEDRCSNNEGMALNLILDGQSSVALKNAYAPSSPLNVHCAPGSRPAGHAGGADALRLSQPDMVLRTGGQVPSDCAMVWDTSVSALFFTDTLWPDLGLAEFEAALRWFRAERRDAGVLTHPIH